MNKRNTRKLMKSSIGKVIKRNHTYYGLPEDVRGLLSVTYWFFGFF